MYVRTYCQKHGLDKKICFEKQVPHPILKTSPSSNLHIFYFEKVCTLNESCE